MEREEVRVQDDQDTMVVMEEDITDRQAVTLLQTRLLFVRASRRHSHFEVLSSSRVGRPGEMLLNGWMKLKPPARPPARFGLGRARCGEQAVYHEKVGPCEMHAIRLTRREISRPPVGWGRSV